jgi:hypothetical protein
LDWRAEVLLAKVGSVSIGSSELMCRDRCFIVRAEAGVERTRAEGRRGEGTYLLRTSEAVSSRA